MIVSLLIISSRYVDTYHSCYTLAGLSAAQHHLHFVDGKEADGSSPYEPALHWTHSNHIPSMQGNPEEEIFDSEDRVKPIHPIYVIPWAAVEQTYSWVKQREGF